MNSLVVAKLGSPVGLVRVESLDAAMLPAVQALGALVFPEEMPDLDEALADYLPLAPEADAERLGLWVAVDAGSRVLGFVGLYGRDELPGEAWLGWFAVRPDCRRQGVGRQLLDRAIQEARQRGLRVLRLWTTDAPDMAASARFYDRAGFLAEPTDVMELGHRVIVRSLALDGGVLCPWAELSPRPATPVS